jgi:hypothetical protein
VSAVQKSSRTENQPTRGDHSAAYLLKLRPSLMDELRSVSLETGEPIAYILRRAARRELAAIKRGEG